MSSNLWKVTAKKTVGKIPSGAWVEIVKNGTTAKPSANEITAAFEAKYGLKIPSGQANTAQFDITKK